MFQEGVTSNFEESAKEIGLCSFFGVFQQEGLWKTLTK